MAMGDLPGIADLAQAQSVAEPDVRLRSVGAAAGHVNRRMAKCDVFAGRHAQLGQLITNRTAPRREPILQSLRIGADGLQGRCEVKLNKVWCLLPAYACGVFGSDGLRPRVDCGSDLGFQAVRGEGRRVPAYCALSSATNFDPADLGCAMERGFTSQHVCLGFRANAAKL